MLTSELKNYISGSLGKGMTETQIRQNLYPQGWTPEDLDEAFRLLNTGTSALSTPAFTTTRVVKKSFGGKIVAVIIAAMLIIGGIGGYYFYFQRDSWNVIFGQTTQDKNTTETNDDNNHPLVIQPEIPPSWEDAVKGHFSCTDLFGVVDFATMFKKLPSDYGIRESKDHYLHKCESRDQMFSFSIWWGDTKIPDIINLEWNFQKGLALKSKLEIKNVLDIGSSAYTQGAYEIEVLSTKKDYIILVSSGTTLINKKPTPTLTLDQIKNMAKIIDANLGKY